MSLIKIPDKLDITITNDDEFLEVEKIFLDAINDKDQKSEEFIEKIVLLLNIYEGSTKLKYSDYF